MRFPKLSVSCRVVSCCAWVCRMSRRLQTISTLANLRGRCLPCRIKTALNPARRSRAKWCASKVITMSVREDSGNEVHMHVDATTETKSKLKPKTGDHVIAKVNDKGHAITFLTDQPISH